MSDVTKNKTDEAGIRLAPAPMKRSDCHTLPSVRQEIAPSVTASAAPAAQNAGEREDGFARSTASDYQPDVRDAGNGWKMGARARNFVAAFVMMLVSAAVILPFVLAACDVAWELPFKLIPEQFDLISGWVDAFKVTIANSWSGEAVNSAWLNMVPNMILTIGFVAVVVNLFKAVTGLFGALRPRRYTVGAVVFLLSAVAVFIAALAGADAIGLAQIDFMQDFIYGWRTSEFFTLFVLGAGNLIVAILCSILTPQRTGYAHKRG